MFVSTLSPERHFSRQLDFPWFPADQWGFEVFGPRICVPDVEIPQGEANGDRTRSARTLRTRLEQVARNVFVRSARVLYLVLLPFAIEFVLRSSWCSLSLQTLFCIGLSTDNR